MAKPEPTPPKAFFIVHASKRDGHGLHTRVSLVSYKAGAARDEVARLEAMGYQAAADAIRDHRGTLPG